MSKFPLLSSYRVLANVAAVILLLIGIVISFGTRTGFNNQLSFGVLLTTILPFAVSAFLLAVVAEIILLWLRIEDHLERSSLTNQRILDVLSRGITAVKSEDAPTEISSDMVKGRIKYASVDVRSIPGARRSVVGTLHHGDSVFIYGTNVDRHWVKIADSSEQWIPVSEVEITGDISNLPVVSDRS